MPDEWPFEPTFSADGRVTAVAIVSRYAAVRAGLETMLAHAYGVKVVGSAADRVELDALIAHQHPDAAVVDMDEPGLAAVLEMLHDRSMPGVVFVEDGQDVRGLVAGLPGSAVLHREAEAEQIAAAIRAAAVGLIVADAERNAGPTALDNHFGGGGDSLTSRERQVLQLMALGLPNKSIAARLGISPHTVKFHVTSVMAKLNAASRTEAVAIGARKGEVKL
jgi:two-component system, NarL family, response regulator YdfI